MTEWSFDRPSSRVRALLWSLSFGNFGLTTLLYWGKGGRQSFCLAQQSYYFCAMLWKCLVITLFGQLRHEYCLHLLLWALWPLLGINASRYLIECAECWILFAKTSKSALQRCLRIHLDCLEVYWLSDAQEQYIWFQACLKKCRGGPWGKLIHPLGIPLAPTICLSWESVVFIFNSCGRSGPKKEGWWHRFWMHLNPILMVYLSLLRSGAVA